MYRVQCKGKAFVAQTFVARANDRAASGVNRQPPSFSHQVTFLTRMTPQLHCLSRSTLWINLTFSHSSEERMSCESEVQSELSK